MLDLIAREEHCDRGHAMQWLLENVEGAAEEAAEANGHGNGHAKGKLGRQVAAYDYVNERGEVLFQVVRFADPKDFRQRRPDPTAAGGWTWKVKGIQPVPYRLPALLTAKTVLIPEGERDCDRLVAAGFCATTNPGGAGKWLASFGHWFADKAVVILCDNDDAGRTHAQDVARHLANHASTIKIVDLPGLPPKGDVSDWLDAGGTAEALQALIDKAPSWQSAEQREWDKPLDIIGSPELVGWPTLTADCLPDSLFRYVMAEAARLNVDLCPLAAHVIAACSISISDAFTIKPKQFDHYTQQARIWVCVVKNVGARGTEMINSAFWPLKERNAEMHKIWLAEKAAWDARQAIKKDKSDPEPRHQRVMTSDATVESMSEILKTGSGTSKLGAVYDELVTFLCGFTRYSEDGGGAVRGVMLEAYDGGPHWIDRIKRGSVYLPNWSLAVAGNIQPRRLAAMAATLVDDGLFQRFLTIHTRPPLLGLDDDRPAGDAAKKEYRDLHATLAQLAPVTADKPLPCYFDEDGRAERQRFNRLIERLQVDPTLPTIIRETAPKWSGMLARLALVFHVVGLAEQRNGGSAPSPEDICRVAGTTVTMAATFLRRIALPNLFRLGFETMPEEGAAAGHARWIAQHILAHGLADIRARDIGRACKDLRGRPVEIAAAMEVLVDTGWVQAVETRRDSLHWAVNPAVHVDFADAAAAEKARRSAVVELIKAKVQDL